MLACLPPGISKGGSSLQGGIKPCICVAYICTVYDFEAQYPKILNFSQKVIMPFNAIMIIICISKIVKYLKNDVS